MSRVLQVENITSYYNREIGSHAKRKMQLFAILFLINLVSVGFFGIVKGYKAYTAKRIVETEAQTVLENLRANLDRANELEPYLESNETVRIMNAAVTEGPRIQDYLTEMVATSSESGFFLGSVSIQYTDEERRADLGMRLHGSPDKTPLLVENIEQLERLTIAKGARISFDEFRGEYSINLPVSIFYIPESEL